VDAHYVGYLPPPINLATTRFTPRFALAKAVNQLFLMLTHRQRVNGTVNRLATNVSIFKSGHYHASELACDLFWRQAVAKHIHDQLKATIAQKQLALRAARNTPGTTMGMRMTSIISTALSLIASYLAADVGQRSLQHSGYLSETHLPPKADLYGGTLFDTEFCVSHKSNTLLKF